jgi:translation initiation factor IF-2
MIRTALKRGIKKVLGMEERVSPAPPPPAWKAETAASTSPSAPAAAAPVEAPAVKASETAPVREEGVHSSAEAPAVKAESVEKPAQLQWTPDERERPGTPLIAEHAQVPSAPAKKELPPSPSVQPVGADDVVGKALSMEAVQEIMDEMVRPALQGDGGDSARGSAAEARAGAEGEDGRGLHLRQRPGRRKGGPPRVSLQQQLLGQRRG